MPGRRLDAVGDGEGTEKGEAPRAADADAVNFTRRTYREPATAHFERESHAKTA